MEIYHFIMVINCYITLGMAVKATSWSILNRVWESNFMRVSFWLIWWIWGSDIWRCLIFPRLLPGWLEFFS